jgi:hypothetical protein
MLHPPGFGYRVKFTIDAPEVNREKIFLFLKTVPGKIHKKILTLGNIKVIYG